MNFVTLMFPIVPGECTEVENFNDGPKTVEQGTGLSWTET